MKIIIFTVVSSRTFGTVWSGKYDFCTSRKATISFSVQKKTIVYRTNDEELWELRFLADGGDTRKLC